MRSAGEILTLAALALCAVALIVVLGNDPAPGSLWDEAAALLTHLGDLENAATAIALSMALTLAGLLAWTLRSRDEAVGRADRLGRELESARAEAGRLRTTLAARDELMLAVVHELRTPLTHVVGYAELLSSGARPRRPDEVSEMSAAIQSASTTMLRLMDDLVEATRSEADGFALKTRPVDLAQLIRGVAAGYDTQEQAHRVTVNLPDRRLPVLADPARVHQVLANLLTNAVSYSPGGGEVRISARQDGDRVRVEIQDHGIGMVPEDRDRAFERLYRAREGRELREHGSGLGLAIVKSLIEAHGGEVGVVSEPGVGSTFWFTLHVTDARSAGADRHSTPLALPPARPIPTPMTLPDPSGHG